MKSRPAVGVGLMLASAGSGCLDILCYRFLGEVFPSAMTGNLALLGRGLGEGDIQAAARNLCAFAGFFAGVMIGAAMLRGAPGRARLVGTLGVQALVLLGFAASWQRDALGPLRFGLIGAAAIGMGMQSAVAHRIGLHAVSTTYFTGTTTNIAIGLVAPSTPIQPAMQRLGWPLMTLGAYLAGAALAGWSATGHDLPDLPIGLPALTAVTTLLLAGIIATVRLPDQPKAPA